MFKVIHFQRLYSNITRNFSSILSPPPFANLDPRGLSQENIHSVQNYGRKL